MDTVLSWPDRGVLIVIFRMHFCPITSWRAETARLCLGLDLTWLPCALEEVSLAKIDAIFSVCLKYSPAVH
jgi:hypothetical protein